MPRLLYFISSLDEITFSTHFYILFYRFLVLHVLNDVREYWIGLTRDSNNSENWNWINDNTQINKNNEIWHKGEPNNFGGNENCALLTNLIITKVQDCFEICCFMCSAVSAKISLHLRAKILT